VARYAGYIEISAAATRGTQSETFRLFQEIAATGLPSGQFMVAGADDVSAAVRHFFTAESQAGAAPAGAPGTSP